MNIFISWSGKESGAVAEILRKLLPIVIDNCPKPWMSSLDLSAGKWWNNGLARQLESSNLGIIVVTPQNILKPWLLFEAGALSKNSISGHVIPYLVSMDKGTFSGPLSCLQALSANREDTYRLVTTINDAMATPADKEILDERFDLAWSKIQFDLNKITEEINRITAEAQKDQYSSDCSPLTKNNEIKCLFNRKDSVKQVKKMYKDIEEYLSGQDITDVVIYDANLQTLKPEGIWEEDTRLVKIARENNVAWYYLAGTNSARKSFNEKWKAEIGWDKLAKGYYKEILLPDEEYPLPNLFSVPKLGQCYIGFGDYESIGMKKGKDNEVSSKGGGIWINNEQAAIAIAHIILNIHELS